MVNFREFLKKKSKLINIKKIKKILATSLLAVGLATSALVANNKIEEYVKNNEPKIEKMADLEAEQEDIARIARELSLQASKNTDIEKEQEEIDQKARELSKEVFRAYKEIPQSFSQTGYSATGIGEKGYYFGDKEKTMKNLKQISPGTSQEKIHNLWKKQGMNFKNGIGVIKDIDGTDRFMVAVADTFGKIGDRVNFKLANGDIIKCIISDIKDRKDSNWSKYGHKYKTPSGKDQINILEFQVNKDKWNNTKYISSEGWKLPWADKIEGKRNNLVSWYNIDENEKGKTEVEFKL